MRLTRRRAPSRPSSLGSRTVPVPCGCPGTPGDTHRSPAGAGLTTELSRGARMVRGGKPKQLLCPPQSAPLTSSLPPGAGPSQPAVSGSAHSRGVPGEETAGASPCPRLQPLSPSTSEERLGRHIYALCVTFPTSPVTCPPSLDSLLSGRRFWSLPPCALFPPPSLHPSPASLGFSFDTNL